MTVKVGQRGAGDVKKSERPTQYAKGGVQGRMVTRPCPCIMKKGKANGGKETGKRR